MISFFRSSFRCLFSSLTDFCRSSVHFFLATLEAWYERRNEMYSKAMPMSAPRASSLAGFLGTLKRNRRTWFGVSTIPATGSSFASVNWISSMRAAAAGQRFKTGTSFALRVWLAISAESESTTTGQRALFSAATKAASTSFTVLFSARRSTSGYLSFTAATSPRGQTCTRKGSTSPSLMATSKTTWSAAGSTVDARTWKRSWRGHVSRVKRHAVQSLCPVAQHWKTLGESR
mmetsp:Transcript_2959/g.8465  ORF Transcript_2959/g.8465 Transcript_2959/m.8465 type:complete len:232 (-) Transcript_2959:390-1085(-)